MKIDNIKEKFFVDHNGKIRLSRLVPTIILTGTLVATSSSSAIAEDIKTDTHQDITQTTLDDAFKIIDIGSYKDLISKRFLVKEDIKNSVKNNIAVSLIVGGNDYSLVDIYKEIDYLKEVLTKYNIDLPIYFNIENIINNKNLSNEYKKALINTYINKCKSNNIYVGLFGTDTSLNKIKEFNIDIPDALVDGDSNIYTGNYSFYKKDGKYYKNNQNIDKVVMNYDYNNPLHFMADKALNYKDYTTQSTLTEKELLDYNNIPNINILGKNIHTYTSKDKKIYLPDVQTINEFMSDDPLKGADLSEFNNPTNWDEIASDFDYLILRIANGTRKDNKLDEFTISATKENIPIGGYLVTTISNEMTESEVKEEIEKEADLAIKESINHNMTYPIYLDIENETAQNLSIEKLSLALNTWYERLIKENINPGLYTSGISASKIKESLNDTIYNNYSLWYAYGEEYDVDKNIKDVTPALGEGDYSWNRSNVTMQQASSHALGSEPPTNTPNQPPNQGYIDVDFSKMDYSKLEEKESKDIPIRPNKNDAYITFALISGAYAIINVAKRKRKTK